MMASGSDTAQTYERAQGLVQVPGGNHQGVFPVACGAPEAAMVRFQYHDQPARLTARADFL